MHLDIPSQEKVKIKPIDLNEDIQNKTISEDDHHGSRILLGKSYLSSQTFSNTLISSNKPLQNASGNNENRDMNTSNNKASKIEITLDEPDSLPKNVVNNANNSINTIQGVKRPRKPSENQVQSNKIDKYFLKYK